jgi:ATP-dependent DNA helicase RecG
MSDEPDWLRIHKALAVEAQYNYTDLQGQQYRFSEFLALSFGKPPTHTSFDDRNHWRKLAFEFAEYHNLTLADRKELLSKASQFLIFAEEVTAKKRHLYPVDSVGGDSTQSPPTGSSVATLQRTKKVLPAISSIGRENSDNLELDRSLRYPQSRYFK